MKYFKITAWEDEPEGEEIYHPHKTWYYEIDSSVTKEEFEGLAKVHMSHNQWYYTYAVKEVSKEEFETYKAKEKAKENKKTKQEKRIEKILDDLISNYGGN